MNISTTLKAVKRKDDAEQDEEEIKEESNSPHTYGGFSTGEYNNIMNYKSKAILPKGSENEKRAFRKRCESFQIIEEILKYVQKGKQRIVLKQNEEKVAIDKVHSTLGHAGRNATTRALEAQYYWRHMIKDVNEFIKNCPSCQLNKAVKPEITELCHVEPPNRPFTVYGIDIVSMPVASNMRYIIVAVDYFTKFPVVHAVPTKEAVFISKFIKEDIVSFFGVPEVIVTKQGAEFKNSIVESVFTTYGIQRRYLSPWSTQKNLDDVEKMNKAIREKLRKKLEEFGGEWTDHLADVMMVIRSTRNPSTKFSPFELLTGTKMRLPFYEGSEVVYKSESRDLDLLAPRKRKLKKLEEGRNTSFISNFNNCLNY